MWPKPILARGKPRLTPNPEEIRVWAIGPDILMRLICARAGDANIGAASTAIATGMDNRNFIGEILVYLLSVCDIENTIWNFTSLSKVGRRRGWDFTAVPSCPISSRNDGLKPLPVVD